MLLSLYPYIKTLHMLTVSLWMASLVGLCLLYVPHAQSPNEHLRNTLTQMEERLLYFWANPMMFATLVLGTVLLVSSPGYLAQGWIHLKLFFMVCMCGFHGTLAKRGRQLNQTGQEVVLSKVKTLPIYPLIFLSVIVFLVMVKPF